MPGIHTLDYAAFQRQAAALLRANRVQIKGMRFTKPSADAEALLSPHISAQAALVWRWFDADMAADELRAATGQQPTDGDDAGVLPVVDYAPADAERTPSRTMTTDTYLVAYAAVQVYHVTGDSTLIERVYPRLVRWYGWIERREDFDNPDVQWAAAVDLDALAHLADDLSLKDEAAEWERRKQALDARIQAALAAQPDDYWLTVRAMFAQALTDAQAAAMAKRVQAALPASGLPNAGPRHRIETIYQWMQHVALRRYGYTRLSGEVAARMVSLAQTRGLAAQYDAGDGTAIDGGRGMTVAALALDMFAREKTGAAPRPTCPQD